MKPKDPHRGRTAPLTSKSCILYIYSTNLGTEYFKHGIYSPFLFLSSKCNLFHNSNVFGSCIIHILYTEGAKIKKIIPAPKESLKSEIYQHYISKLISYLTEKKKPPRFLYKDTTVQVSNLLSF